MLHLITVVISDAEVQTHFDEFFEEIFVEMEDKVVYLWTTRDHPRVMSL